MLDRILKTPQLEQVIPLLQPELLHRVIKVYGLEDCGEVVALATPQQLARIFDLDLWSAPGAGRDEQFDAGRFGVWLEVLVETGAEVAAQKLAGMEVDYVVAGLAKHVLIYDRATVTPYETMDGEQVEPIGAVDDDGFTLDIGGYRLVAQRSDSWDAIVEVLLSLDAGHTDYFHRVMKGCRTLSNSGREDDGLDDLLSEGDQAMFDLEVDRERRREKQGYVTPAQARAFLQMSRQLNLGSDAPLPANPLAHAYFRGLDDGTGEDSRDDRGLLAAKSAASPAHDDTAEAVRAVFDILREAGVVAQPPRALLGASESHSPRLGRIEAYMKLVLDRDPEAYSRRSEELAYLANTLMSGCSIQARRFTAQEASDAAVAVCNLGLQNWPPHWTNAAEPPGSFLIDHDLVSVFGVGWAVIYRDVSMYAAEQLIVILTDLRCDDREIQTGLNALQIKMAKHWRAGEPWRARSALDAIAPLDLPAWAVLLALMDEFPVLHKTVGALRDSRILSVSVSDFEFISENSQIACVREFMKSLPEVLRADPV